MTEKKLEYVAVEPPSQADACAIWLHGLGANGHDFADIIPSLKLPATHSIRFIFPHAPSRPVSINANMVMPAWFDIFGLDFHAQVDEKGIAWAQSAVQQLMEEQILKGIPAQRIFLIGFSQGGALALYTALLSPKMLAGAAGLSTYLPKHENFLDKKASLNLKLPLFLAHGLLDPVVPYWMGQHSFTTLQEVGYQPSWHSYPIAHTVCIPECEDLGQWMINILY